MGSAEAAGPILKSFGARFLARGIPVKVYEGGANERCVVAEFDSVDKAIAAYESPAYQAALAILKDACVREVRIVPGAD